MSGGQVKGLKPRRNNFDLGHDVRGNMRYGELIPVLYEECIPGDTWHLREQHLLRHLPTVTPMMENVRVQIHAFFIPHRLSVSYWETFYFGGVSGNAEPPLPEWDGSDPINIGDLSGAGTVWTATANARTDLFSSWDYVGHAIGYVIPPQSQVNRPVSMPNCLFLRAMIRVWWEYYRDSDLQRLNMLCSLGETIEVADHDFDIDWFKGRYTLETGVERTVKQGNIGNLFSRNGVAFGQTPLWRNWNKDYFTTARPWQQRGDAPAFPIAGQLPIFGGMQAVSGGTPVSAWGTSAIAMQTTNATNYPAQVFGTRSGLSGFANPWYADLSNAATFDVADLRLIVQTQKWMERAARAGARYTDRLRAHYGVSPRDERLQRAEYIGGATSYITISEVLQTGESSSSSPQGNMAGHGMDFGSDKLGSYRVYEPGCIIALMSVMPDISYENGIDRIATKKDKFDFYFPEFENLSEQAVLRYEIFANGGQNDDVVFGFQGNFDEYRHRRSRNTGQMRINTGSTAFPTMADWHLGIAYSAAPLLNHQFISLEFYQAQLNRVFAYTGASARNIIYTVSWTTTATRPMSHIAEPGLVDHH